MVSISEGLKMMGGGEDQTGYGGIADYLSDRRPQKDTTASDFKKFLQAMAEGQSTLGSETDGMGSDIGEMDSTIPGIGQDTGGFSFGDMFSSLTPTDEETGEITDQSMGESALTVGSGGAGLVGFSKLFNSIMNRIKPGKIIGRSKGNIPLALALTVPEIAYGVGDAYFPDQTTAVEEAIGSGINKGLDFISPVTEPIGEYIDEKNTKAQAADDAFKKSYLDSGIIPGDMVSSVAPTDIDASNISTIDKAVQGMMDPDDLKEYMAMQEAGFLPNFPEEDYSFAGGGRVEAGIGGWLRGLLGDEEARDPEYDTWKEMYELNPEVGEMHDNYGEYIKQYEDELATGGRVGMQTGGSPAPSGGTPYADIHNQILQPSNQTNAQPHQSSWSPLTGSGTVQPNPGAQAVNQSGIGGALTNLIQQNPQIAEMLQGLNQQNLPGQVQNQMYTPPHPQQPWSPYVGSNPFAGSTGFYDPSTLNKPTNYSDPVMLGGPDPYQMYDPYTPSMPGAGRAQPLDTGTQPTGAPRPGYMLTPEEISEQFADTTKYSLEAQRLKSEEEARIRKEEEAKKKRVHQGGEGGANTNN